MEKTEDFGSDKLTNNRKAGSGSRTGSDLQPVCAIFSEPENEAEEKRGQVDMCSGNHEAALTRAEERRTVMLPDMEHGKSISADSAVEGKEEGLCG